MNKQILILGGTQFVGRHLCERLEKRPDLSVTLFHRGKTNPELFPGFRHVLGDREAAGWLPLVQQDWDAVVDFSGYYPRSLREILIALRGRVRRYIFVSTISVYDLERPLNGEMITAESPILSWTEADESDRTLLTYGQRKAACEAALLSFPELNPVIFRPGLIYGPYDPTDRLYYWLWRCNQHDTFLVPEPLSQRIQMTYAPDFARILESALFMPKLSESVYLALTHAPLALSAILASMCPQERPIPNLKTVTGPWLESHSLQYWQDFPLTLPFEICFDQAPILRDFAGCYTPFVESMARCRDYYGALGWPIPQTGLSPEREAAFLSELTMA